MINHPNPLQEQFAHSTDEFALLNELARLIAHRTGNPEIRPFSIAVIFCQAERDDDAALCSVAVSGEKTPEILVMMIEQLASSFGATVEATEMKIEALH